mmetsp:Transcript_1631/g.1453  ORF Transcript_1631/g.1453 Transcript_1631/m.1453 type:complete len:85 (-) Transcript_1631:517-771(-)
MQLLSNQAELLKAIVNLENFDQISKKFLPQISKSLFSDNELQKEFFDKIYETRFTGHAKKLKIASNAITMLNAARVSFSGMDLS